MELKTPLLGVRGLVTAFALGGFLDGVAFRQALDQSSAIASGVIRMLARQLRKAQL